MFFLSLLEMLLEPYTMNATKEDVITRKGVCKRSQGGM